MLGFSSTSSDPTGALPEDTPTSGISFDAANRRIVLDGAAVTGAELWSRWSDWAAASDNAKYLPAFRQTGGDDLGAGLFIPPYFFLLNGWRVRPMESNHTLIITGNLFVEGGGVPVVNTLGAFNVSAQYTVPVQAQGISTSGGSGGLTVDQASMLARIEKLLRNKQVTDPAAGTMTVFDDDGATVLLTGALYEDAAAAQPYRGQGAERRERLA